MNTARMIRADFSASHKITSTMMTVADAVDQGALLDGCEFFVGHGHRPGQPYARLIFRLELQIGYGFANGIARGSSWLQCGKIQHRMNFDKAPQICPARAACRSAIPARKTSPDGRRSRLLSSPPPSITAAPGYRA